MPSSRTLNSLRNSVVALTIYFANLILQFVSRKVFLDHLGLEVLGLNSTISSILQILNIAELGIGTAIACTLYQPLSVDNRQEICEIVSLQGWLYKKIAYFILACGIVIMCFLAQIFSKVDLPIWYAYTTFGVLLFSTLLTYFVTYKQILLSASQQEYKIQLSYKLSMLVKILVQIIAVKQLSHGYIWWISIEFVFALIACWSVNKQVHLSFPYLEIKNHNIKELLNKYPTVKKKVFQLFFHKIASFALSQISPIILYAYTTIAMVAIYGNYTLITLGITSLLAAIFNGLNASVGNLVAEGDKSKILSVFKEIFASRFLIVCSCSICLYYLCNPLVKLWIGHMYTLDNTFITLLTIIFYMNTMRTVVDSFIQAYGLFYDIWAPIAEATLNIGLSIVFGANFGLNGILLGVLISLLIIVFIWKPIFLFRQGFQANISYYIKLYLRHIVVLGFALIPICISAYLLNISNINNFIGIIITALCLFAISFLTIGIGLYICEPGMRDFTHRFKHILKRLL